MKSYELNAISGSHPDVTKETPLIDRAEEMQLLKQAADNVREKQGRLFFLYGEAGIGKTRLTKELTAYVRSCGMQILRGKCPSLFRPESVPPYVLWKEVIRNYLQNCTPEQLQNAVGYYPGEIYKIVPEIKQKLGDFPESPPLSPELERDRLFEAVSQFVTNISKSTPLLVVLDDLQWCDVSSLMLLHYLGRGVYRDRLLLLGAYRDFEVEEKHPLFPILTDLNRDRLLWSAKLKRLSLDEVSDMIKQILCQDEVPRDLCKIVFDKTRGNPFFVEEVMQSLLEEGIVYPYGVEYRFKEISQIEFPETVKSVLGARLGRLDDETRNVLTMASFIGNEFTFEALHVATGLDADQLMAMLEKMVEKRLLKCRTVRGDVTCTFSDVLVRDVLYENVGPLRARKFHAIVAGALEKVFSADIDDHLAELAAHFLESGDRVKALDYFLKAGEKAAKVYANSEAASSYESALKLMDEMKGELREKARILEALGDVKSFVGDCESCLKRWNEAMQLWEQLGEKEKVARLYRKSSNVLMHKMGSPEKAKEHQRKALEILEALPETSELANLRSEMAHTYWHTGEMAAALPFAEKAVETANRVNDSEAIANSYMVLGKLARFQGDKKTCSESIEKALKIAQEKGYTEIALSAYASVSPEVESGRDAKSQIERSQEVYEMAKKVGAISYQSWFGDSLAGLYAGRGSIDRAIELSEESVALDRKVGNLHNLPRSLSTLGNIFLTLGEWDRAESYFNEALSISQKQNLIVSIAGVYTDLGALNNLKGNFAKAGELFEKAIELFRKSGVRAGEAFIFGATWASIGLGDLEKAENQVNIMRVIGQKTNHKSFFALADLGKATILRVQKNWDESIKYFEKSLQELEESNVIQRHLVLYARRFLCEYAQVFLERDLEGDREKARNLLSQALEIFRKLNAKKDIEKTEAALLSIERGRPVTWDLKSIGIVETGYAALDKLLYGGLHIGASIAISSSISEERNALIKSFLETGAEKGESTCFLTIDPGLSGILPQKYPNNFYLFVCNPQAETIVKPAPNIFTLKGVESLTNINIALTQTIRRIDPTQKKTRRICVDIISDVLLQHHSVQTRKWLTELLTQLRSAGFTTLAVIDPQMHPAEELHAILSLFDGEINIREAENERGLTSFLKVKRLSGQKYLKEETMLTEE